MDLYNVRLVIVYKGFEIKKDLKIVPRREVTFPSEESIVCKKIGIRTYQEIISGKVYKNVHYFGESYSNFCIERALPLRGYEVYVQDPYKIDFYNDRQNKELKKYVESRLDKEAWIKTLESYEEAAKQKYENERNRFDNVKKEREEMEEYINKVMTGQTLTKK